MTTKEQFEAEKISSDNYLLALEEELSDVDELWLYLDHRDKFSKLYSIDLVRRYYLDNPLIAANLKNTVKAMLATKDIEPMSTVVMAMTSIEVLTKNVILKPFLMGMLHNSYLADMVTRQLLTQNGLDRFNSLIHWIFDEHLSERDCKSELMKSPYNNRTIWHERASLQKKRNAIIHRAECCEQEDAENAIKLFGEFDRLVCGLVDQLDLRFMTDTNGVLCVVDGRDLFSSWRFSNFDENQYSYNEPPMDFDDEIPC